MPARRRRSGGRSSSLPFMGRDRPRQRPGWGTAAPHPTRTASPSVPPHFGGGRKPTLRSHGVEFADPVAGLYLQKPGNVGGAPAADGALRREEAEGRFRVQRAGGFADRADVDTAAFEGGVGGEGGGQQGLGVGVAGGGVEL